MRRAVALLDLRLAGRVEGVGPGPADADVGAAVPAQAVVPAAPEDAVVAAMPRIVSATVPPSTRFDVAVS